MKRQFILNTFKMSGITIMPFIPIGRNIPTSDSEFPSVNNALEDFDFSTGESGQRIMSNQLLGVPVWCDLWLKEIRDGGMKIQILQSIATIQMKKNVVKTGLQGRNGTVKEYISAGDWQVSIKGAFCDLNPTRYPLKDTALLNSICMLPEAIEIVGEYFQHYGIHNLVIEDYEFPQRAGYQNMQAFNIKAVSDEPIQLKLAKNV